MTKNKSDNQFSVLLGYVMALKTAYDNKIFTVLQTIN